MLILLGSKNPSKLYALKMALKKLQLANAEIITADVKSNVPSKPIGFEIVRGCENRNAGLKEYAKANKIKYDYICSIEGGFSIDENGLPFVVTYAVVEDNLGNKSTGKSLGVRINREMFRYIRENGSLNEAIEKINSNKNNKQSQGITGYLSNGIISRAEVDKDAVISAFIPLIFQYNYKMLTKKLN